MMVPIVVSFLISIGFVLVGFFIAPRPPGRPKHWLLRATLADVVAVMDEPFVKPAVLVAVAIVWGWL